jgi:hypothetical protein
MIFGRPANAAMLLVGTDTTARDNLLACALPKALPQTGVYRFELDGRYMSQRSLGRTVGPRTVDGLHVEARVALTVTSLLRHKVAIRLNGRKIGFLPPLLARSYLREVRHWGVPRRTFSCMALVQGGWRRGIRNSSPFIVSLDLPILPDRWPDPEGVSYLRRA